MLRFPKIPDALFETGLLALAALALIPVATNGFRSDDLVNASISGNGDYFGYLRDDLRMWFVDRGRINALTIAFTDSVHWFLPRVFPYKIFLCALILSNVWLAGRFVQAVSGSVHWGFLAMLLAPLAFQLRLYHDPLLDFAGMLPFFMDLILASLLLALRWDDTGKKAFLVFSLAFYLASILLYELAFPLLMLFPLLFFFRNRSLRHGVRASLPFTILAVSMSLLTLLLRVETPGGAGYYGITPSWSPAVILSTYAKQLVAGLPLSYVWGDPSFLFTYDPVFTGPVPWHEWLARAGFGAALVALGARIFRDPPVEVGGLLALFGLLLALLVALLISFSAKYQAELHLGDGSWGLGYLPVYPQALGGVLVALGVLMAALRRLSPRGALWAKIASGVMILAVMVPVYGATLAANRKVSEQSNIDLHFRRQSLVLALEAGVLGDLPEGSRLLLLDEYTPRPYAPRLRSDLQGWSRSYRWRNSAFVKVHSGKTLRVCDTPEGARDLMKQASGGDGASPLFRCTLYSHGLDSYRAWDPWARWGWVRVERLRGADPTAPGELLVHWDAREALRTGKVGGKAK